jgi:class 3 adenylate cyclase
LKARSRTAFQAYGGHEVDTQGDSFFAAFPSAQQAISCAADAQRALATHVWPRGVTVRVRMGLHTGEPAVGSEGYLGIDVVRADGADAMRHWRAQGLVCIDGTPGVQSPEQTLMLAADPKATLREFRQQGDDAGR